MDIKLKQKKYWIPKKYWLWAGGGALIIVLLIWLATMNFTSTLRVDRRGLSIGKVSKAQFDDYVSVDGSVVPIQVVQISSEEGGVVLEKVKEEGTHVSKGDVIIRLNNSNLDLEILNAESELAEKQNMLRSTRLSMEQDQLNNSNEALQLSMDVKTKRRAYNHQAALQKEELNSREDYLKAKEEYELAVQKEKLIRQRLKKTNELNRSQVEQMASDLASMRKNVELVRERKARLNVRSTIDGEIGLLDVELGQSISPGTENRRHQRPERLQGGGTGGRALHRPRACRTVGHIRTERQDISPDRAQGVSGGARRPLQDRLHLQRRTPEEHTHGTDLLCRPATWRVEKGNNHTQRHVLQRDGRLVDIRSRQGRPQGIQAQDTHRAAESAIL